jgi:hypothetical protein
MYGYQHVFISESKNTLKYNYSSFKNKQKLKYLLTVANTNEAPEELNNNILDNALLFLTSEICTTYCINLRNKTHRP